MPSSAHEARAADPADLGDVESARVSIWVSGCRAASKLSRRSASVSARGVLPLAADSLTGVAPVAVVFGLDAVSWASAKDSGRPGWIGGALGSGSERSAAPPDGEAFVKCFGDNAVTLKGPLRLSAAGIALSDSPGPERLGDALVARSARAVGVPCGGHVRSAASGGVDGGEGRWSSSQASGQSGVWMSPSSQGRRAKSGSGQSGCEGGAAESGDELRDSA